MQEKAEAQAKEQTSKLGVKCKSSIKAGGIKDTIQSNINSEKMTQILKEYAMFPFSLTQNADCDCSKS